MSIVATTCLVPGFLCRLPILFTGTVMKNECIRLLVGALSIDCGNCYLSTPDDISSVSRIAQVWSERSALGIAFFGLQDKRSTTVDCRGCIGSREILEPSATLCQPHSSILSLLLSSYHTSVHLWQARGTT